MENNMHSLAPYTIRSFNSNLPGKTEDKYAALDKVGSHDTFKILCDLVNSKKSEFHIIEESKQVYRFNRVEIDDDKRILCGWFQLGSYGMKTDIINVTTGKVDYKKTQENAEIINHFIYISMPRGYNEGISLLHLYRGNGFKTVFYDLFRKHFSEITKCNLQMNPLSYDKAMTEWENANAKEIRLIKFCGLSDIADTIKKLGHDEQVLILKSPRKGTLGKLRDYWNKESEQAKAIELLTPVCAKIKTVVELGGKKRIFSLGHNVDNAICEVEAPEDLELEFGNPKYEAIKAWCVEIASEFSSALYKDKKVTS
jgi:hypothetical protein